MSERYPGGLIRKTPPTVTGPTDGEGGSAPGIWTLEEVAYYEKEGSWPKRTLPRELYAWGDNSSGQLGINTANTDDRSSPSQVGALTNWNTVSGGKDFAVAVKKNGQLWSWGENGYGQLAIGDTVDRSSPVQIGALTNWSQAAAAREACLAVKTDNTLWFWGRNSWGQKGDSTVTGDASSPVQVGSDTDWASVSAFRNSVIAVKTNGELYSWGLNSNGGLGHNDTVSRSSPVQVGALTTWSKAETGAEFCQAIKTDGSLWGWGFQQFHGNVGNSSRVNVSSPIQIGSLTNWSSVDNSKFAVAIKTDGTMWTWGQGGDGQLGHSDNLYRSSPTQVGSLTTWLQASTGYYTCYAIKTDKTAWSWGFNGQGQLGTNESSATRARVNSPIQIGSDTDWDFIEGNQGGSSEGSAYGVTKGS